MKLELPKDRLERIQLRRLKRVVRRAYFHSSFYRELYDQNGFHPDQLRTLDDIDRIPIVNRKMLQAAQEKNPSALTTRKLSRRGMWSQTTSGSTGVPITIFATRFERWRILLVILRGYRLNGLRWSEVSITIKDPVDIARPNLVQRLKGYRHEYYDIYSPIEVTCSRICAKWREIAVLKSMPSDLANLAWYVNNSKTKFPRVNRIFSDSEKLDSTTRAFIENAFGAKIFDFYATTEFGIVAFQTPKSEGKYLVNDDALFLETMNNELLEDGDKDLVITGLINQTTPIIRYRIGDVARLSRSNSAGKTTCKTLDYIHGKYLDFIVRPDGSIVSSHAVKQNLTHLPGVRRFQVVQESLDEVRVLVAPDELWSDQTLQQIVTLFSRDLGSSIHVDVILDPSIVTKHVDYKKFKVVESKVAQRLLSEDI